MSLKGFNPSVSKSAESSGARNRGCAAASVSLSASPGEAARRSPVAHNAVVHPIQAAARTGCYVLDYQI